MTDLEKVDSELVVAEEADYNYGYADFSEIQYVKWPLEEARHRIAKLITKHPGYAEEGSRALGYIDLAESILKQLSYATYGDYGHVA